MSPIKQPLCWPTLLVISLGLMVGGWVAWSPGSAFMFTFLVAVGLVLHHRAAPEDRRFLVWLYAAAIGARIVIGGLVHLWAVYYGLGWVRFGMESFDIFGDSAWVSLKGWLNAKTWLGQLERSAVDALILDISDSDRGAYLYAAFHGLFGFSQFSVKLINSALGVVTALLAHAIVRDLAGRQAAAVAAILVAFFPSTLLWSVTNLKDTPNSLGVIWAYWAMLQGIRRGYGIAFLLSLIGAVGFLHLVRPSLSPVVIVGIVLGLGWSLLCRPAGRLLRVGCLVVLAIAVFYVVPHKTGIAPERYWRSKVESTLGQLVGVQSSQSFSPGSSYQLYPERFYEYTSNKSPLPPTVPEVAQGLVKGSGYFLLAPVPWAITTLLQIPTIPEMILWYLLLVFAALGIWRLMRAAPAEGGALLLWVFVLSSLNALTTGNMGVAFRHRSMVIPLYLMLSAMGFLPMWERMRRHRAAAVPVV